MHRPALTYSSTPAHLYKHLNVPMPQPGRLDSPLTIVAVMRGMNPVTDRLTLPGALQDMNVPQRHKNIVELVDEMGPNFFLRAAWWNVVVVTEVSS